MALMRRLRGRDPFEEVIELAGAQSDEHRLVLLLHQRPHFALHLLVADVLRVGSLLRSNDAPAVCEKVRDDVRMLDPRILGLDMKDAALVSDVVVEAEERRLGFHRQDCDSAERNIRARSRCASISAAL
jgi:hypothetical protein